MAKSDNGHARFRSDIVHPITAVFRHYCDDIIMRAYQAAMRECLEAAEVFVRSDNSLRVVEIARAHASLYGQPAHL